MGMESDNHAVLSFEEQQEMEKQAEARKKALEEEKANDPEYTAICTFYNRKNELKYLIIDKNRKYYTLDFVEYIQDDPKNNTSPRAIWTKIPVPISEEDYHDFWG